VVDAFAGSWGWIAVDEIQITNAIVRQAVMLVDWSDDLIGFDQVQIDHLEGLGYSVTTVQQEDIANGVYTVADADAMDLVIISESIISSNANNLIGTTTPILTQESNAYDDWGHMGSPSIDCNWRVGAEMDVVNDTHPIAVAAGLSIGKMDFFSQTTDLIIDVASNLAPGAVSIVELTPDGLSVPYAVVWAIDKGAELADGSAAPNRVVGFAITGYHEVTAETMTDEAWAIYDAALDWLVPLEAVAE
jgi:hypothetical protein